MANNKIVAVDVLPEADLYAVYAALDQAEEQGIIEFEEGHCGHPLREQGSVDDSRPNASTIGTSPGRRL